MNKRVKYVINFAGMLVVIASAVIGNVLCSIFESQINSFFCPPISNNSNNEVSTASGEELAKNIVLDGAVLAKNNGALPLNKSSDNKINIFGWSVTDWVMSGGGSGTVSPKDNDWNNTIDLLKAFDNYEYGVTYNQDLIDAYSAFKSPTRNVGFGQSSGRGNTIITEPAITDKTVYTDKLLEDAKAFSSTALVVISRTGHESGDLDPIYLHLTDKEKELLTYVGENYEKVVVLINACNTMVLEPLDNIKGIDAVLVVGATGTHGAAAIPYLLYGDTSPSGHFADTYAYEFESNVNYDYITNLGKYTNASEYLGDLSNKSDAYMDFVESIYVGYKWYETADHEGIWNNSKYSRTILDNEGNNKTLKGYDSVVQYPFGYGLSYTTFEWSNASIEIKDKDNKVISDGYITDESKITINVTVKNTGAVAGKDVVQVYLTAPFTKGGIEKSYVSLVGYEKTIVLEPQSEQKLSIEIDANDFTSYDCYDMNKNNHTGYELESGDYELKLMTDSHNMKKLDKNTFVVKVKDTINLTKDKYTGQDVNNKFTYPNAYDGYALDGNNGEENANIPYIKRGAFPDPYEFKKGENRKVTSEIAKKVRINQTLGDEWDNATKDVFGRDVDTSKVLWNQTSTSHKISSNGRVTELGYELGNNYDDEKWEELLNQAKISSAVNLVGNGYAIVSVNEIGLPSLSAYDGPLQIKGYNPGIDGKVGTGYPSNTVLAQTFNKKLALQWGVSYGTDCVNFNIASTWAPGTNIHRTPIGGRNFEYYSEDPYLSSTTVVNAIIGLQRTGTFPYLKHFALNPTENHRNYLYNWCTEQALRETYLKSFQKAIQVADCMGLMTSYGRAGICYTGGSEALIEGVARTEWGFKGVIVTDYSYDNKFMNIDHGLRAGNDLGMGSKLNFLGADYSFNYTETATPRIQRQLKKAIKHAAYAYLHTQCINKAWNEYVKEHPDQGETIDSAVLIDSWNWWKPTVLAIDIMVGCGIVCWAYFVIRRKEWFEEAK